MSLTQNLEQRLADYYQTEAPPRAPDWLLTRVLDAIDTTPQRRFVLGRPWRLATMTSSARLAVGAAALVVITAVGLAFLRPPSVGPSAELGIFAPVAGRIVFSDDGLWAVDPRAPSVSTMVRIGPAGDSPLGWSRDGTDLLLRRRVSSEGTGLVVGHLYVLHADGTETQLNRDAMGIWGATIAPDGSRAVFAATDAGTSRSRRPGLFVIDADGGEPVRIAAEGDSPTFSPDGTQVAYLVSGSGRSQLWVADANGSDAHEILADEPALVEGVLDLAWSPAGDRIAIENSLEGHVAIYTVAPDGSDFRKVISDGINPFWSPDGSQIAYMPVGGRTPGLAIADADGSNVREFGFGASGPWHPGPLGEVTPPTQVETPTPVETLTAVETPALPPSPLSERFDSAVHGLSINYPSGWQTRPATEPWTDGELTFDAPAADVIFDPALEGRVYFALASLPRSDIIVNRPPDGGPFAGNEWDLMQRAGMPCDGGGGGRFTVDGFRAFDWQCHGPASVGITTPTRGYVIKLVVEEAGLLETYDLPSFGAVLETVDLRPEEALDAIQQTPSVSP